ncbi:MAG: response regulator transcription factor [Alphaproteobacteria bacterium]|nr:response regulator transcription factor [Alphaproteobacteria bacterium]MCB9794550.1 response regulator transcription factor [Alphaproteobacteria bacterium]
MTHHILIVEDDVGLAAGLVSGLKAAGFRVSLCNDGDAAAEAFEREPPDLVVLDLMLPGRDGLSLLESWRATSAVPVIVLTARGELDERLRCFELGAVDFVPKPFWMKELLARVRARLRLPEEAPHRVLRWADVALDLDARTLCRAGEALSLTKSELDIVAYLAERPGRAVSRGQLAAVVLGDETLNPRTVDGHVARARSKLGEAAAAAIHTVWGVGYRFEAAP